jgi:DNA-binding transcriptional regulator WhiA
MLIECLDESYNIVQEELEYEHAEGIKTNKDYVTALFRDEEKIKGLFFYNFL